MEDDGTIVSLAEVKRMLEKEAKKRELTYEQDLALKHAEKYATISMTNVRAASKELQKIERINELLANKIIELNPMNADEVRAIFTKERFNLEPNEIEEILKTLKKYS
jgi:DNA-directed RNA polymerase subunit F